MKIKKGFVMRDVCGEHVLVGEGTEAVDFNRLVKFNDVAAFLWEKASAMDNFTDELLADLLVSEYNVDGDTALGDTRKLLANWQKEGLVC